MAPKLEHLLGRLKCQTDKVPLLSKAIKTQGNQKAFPWRKYALNCEPGNVERPLQVPDRPDSLKLSGGQAKWMGVASCTNWGDRFGQVQSEASCVHATISLQLNVSRPSSWPCQCAFSIRPYLYPSFVNWISNVRTWWGTKVGLDSHDSALLVRSFLNQGHAATVRSDGRWMFHKAVISAKSDFESTWTYHISNAIW